ncbi:C40 family peptidase [Actinoplanes couchii]|nr:NlpC/P60 family protein [Actinoplanes couchii]MDR6323966.1 cell wall-associated NlpC family hydrolase [Actinoplanes couchii]
MRHLALSAAVAAAIAALFQPVPAMADPGIAVGIATVPNSGSRPVQTGELVLPGSPATPATSPATSTLTVPGVIASPVIQKVEKGRAEIAALGDQLIRVGQDRDLAQTQLTTASQRVSETQLALAQAREQVKAAAAETMQLAAALPPGSLDTGLLELDALARVQRGDTAPYEASARRVLAAEDAVRVAGSDHVAANNRYTSLLAQWTALNTDLTAKQAAQKKYEDDHRDEITAAESTATAADQQAGQDILAGSDAGRGADPRAVRALQFALSQRGDPYVWSEEGPDAYDCSGLMYAAYRGVGYPLVRVSRDQYYQTRDRTVSRYSLLPGDLLFFSSSSSWTGIHHVAMYAGEGMMVEAPRTGLNVRLTPVRWTRLFAATRVYGSIEGETETPDLGSPDPDEPVPATTKPSPSSSPSKTGKPSSSPSPSGSPSTSPSSSKSPSSSPSSSKSPSSSPSQSPSSSPSTSPSPSTSTAPSPSPSPSASASRSLQPEPTADPTSAAASTSASKSTGSSASGASSASGSASGTASKSASSASASSED